MSYVGIVPSAVVPAPSCSFPCGAVLARHCLVLPLGEQKGDESLMPLIRCPFAAHPGGEEADLGGNKQR